MKLFNVADKVIKDSPFYFLSKNSKLLDEASKLDFSFEVLDSEIGLRKIKFDVEHLYTFLRFYHLLGDYKKKVELLVKLAKGKRKLDSLAKRG